MSYCPFQSYYTGSRNYGRGKQLMNTGNAVVVCIAISQLQDMSDTEKVCFKHINFKK